MFTWSLLPMRIQYCHDVEVVFLLSKSYMGVLVILVCIRILMPEFFMPELLIKELCSYLDDSEDCWAHFHTTQESQTHHRRQVLYVNVYLDIQNVDNVHDRSFGRNGLTDLVLHFLELVLYQENRCVDFGNCEFWIFGYIERYFLFWFLPSHYKMKDYKMMKCWKIDFFSSYVKWFPPENAFPKSKDTFNSSAGVSFCPVIYLK